MLAEKFTGSLRGCAFIIFLYITAQSSACLTDWGWSSNHTVFFHRHWKAQSFWGSMLPKSERWFPQEIWRHFRKLEVFFLILIRLFAVIVCVSVCLSVCFSACVWNVKNSKKIYEIKRVEVPSFYSNLMLKMTMSSRNS